MKKRRVIFLIELESTDTVEKLKFRIKNHLELYLDNKVIQVQSNVVQKRTNPKSRGKR
jgi:hypothetical protein